MASTPEYLPSSKRKSPPCNGLKPLDLTAKIGKEKASKDLKESQMLTAASESLENDTGIRESNDNEDNSANGKVDEVTFLCRICRQGFQTEQELADHQSKHEEVKPYSCEICGKRSEV